MCGRYEFTLGFDPMLDHIARLDGEWTPGEMCPGMPVPVLVMHAGKVKAELQRWGFAREGGTRLVINARAETAHEKPMFRECLRARRCAIPASGFYEWDSQRRKYRFDAPNAIYLAGIYEETPSGRHCCILTTAANACMEDIHDRMPVVLEKDEVRAWLGNLDAARGLLNCPAKMLRRTALDGQLTLW